MNREVNFTVQKKKHFLFHWKMMSQLIEILKNFHLCTQYQKYHANDAEEMERYGLFKKSKVRITKLNALNPESVFGITSMSNKHVRSQETLHDVKLTDEDGLLSSSMMMKAKDIIMNERISAVREEPNYHAAENKFERFRGFLQLISRFEFEFRRCGNYIFWTIRIFGAFMWMCRGLVVPTQFHFECCGFLDGSRWHIYTFQWNHCGRSCKSFVILGFGWRKTNRTLIVKVGHNKRG